MQLPEFITQEQHNRVRLALDFWHTIKPEQVVPDLADWQRDGDCGTLACFGGWLAKAGLFELYPNEGACNFLELGAPTNKSGGRASSEDLFGVPHLFWPRYQDWLSDNDAATDHEAVVFRLQAVLAIPVKD